MPEAALELPYEGAKEMLANSLYDFALGAAMGGFGGVTSIGS